MQRRPDLSNMKFTYYGHACFSVEAGGKTLLFDPFISPNPLAKEIDVKKITADFILVSHGHGDHVADVIEIANRTGATVIAPFEVGSWFEAKGVKNVQAMNHGGVAKMNFGRVKLTSAIHSSSMPDGSYGGNPCGFVVESSDVLQYVWGKLLGKREQGDDGGAVVDHDRAHDPAVATRPRAGGAIDVVTRSSRRSRRA